MRKSASVWGCRGTCGLPIYSRLTTLVGKIRDDRPLHAYEHWLANFDIVQPGERRLIDRLLARWGNLPRVCLHLVNGGDEAARQRTLASIAALCYPATHITVLEQPSDSVRPEGEWQWAIPVGRNSLRPR
jgi:hypothetical protein